MSDKTNTYITIGKMFDVSAHVIKRILERNNIKARTSSETSRIYSLAESSFSEVTPNSAYSAGRLNHADGSISKSTRKRQKWIWNRKFLMKV